MLGQPRLDTSGALHHLMGHGIDGKEIFVGERDRDNFMRRLEDLGEIKAISVCG